MTRHFLISGLLAAIAAAGCASPGGGNAPGSPDQLKQSELQQMEKAGQRNDIDKPLSQ
jgi:hypothetical protein